MQRRWRRGSKAGQLRARDPPIVRLMTPYLVAAGCFGLSRVLCVICWLFLDMIRTHVVMDVLLPWVFATARKHVRREKLSQNNDRHRILPARSIP